MTNRTFTVRELARAMGISQQAVQKRASREAWQYTETIGRGGKRRLYSLGNLPADIQKTLVIKEARRSIAIIEQQPAEESGAQFEYDPESLWGHYSRKPEKQKAKAKAKHELMMQVMHLVEAGYAWQDAFKTVGKANNTSWCTLRDIYHGKPGRPGLKLYERSDWLAALISSYVGRTTKAELSQDAWDYIKADYLRNEKPSLTACYVRLTEAAQAHGWSIPSAKTIERRIQSLPMAMRVYLRDGEHALLRLFPAMQRSVRGLHALEWINGDGYQHNVFVKWPNGTIGRPKTWFWQDVYSRRFLAWRTDETEHTDVIRFSFGEVIERFGIPSHATIDNTRAAANKWMTGGVPNRYRFKVRDEDPLGIFPMLGVKVHWTSIQSGKGHGQAKPVERAFGVGGIGEYVDKHPALAGAYTGHNPQAKPENYASRAVPIETFLEILVEGVNTWNALTKRQTEVCGGTLSFDQAFEQSYRRASIRKATGEQRRLWMLTAESVKVARDGTFTMDAGGVTGVGKNRYGDDALLEFIRHPIVVRFDPAELYESVHTYTLDGRYIGEAACIQAAGYGDSEAGRAHNRARKQKMRAAKDIAKAEQRMDALKAARLLPQTDPPEDPDAVVVRGEFRHRKRAVGGDIVHTDSDERDGQFKAGVALLRTLANKNRI